MSELKWCMDVGEWKRPKPKGYPLLGYLMIWPLETKDIKIKAGK